ncbi:hypothetical protein HFD88_008660 [Aspergillus terreus]|nr:hypothetical protein HFD88_008660 [Aspergillus terreus]
MVKKGRAAGGQGGTPFELRRDKPIEQLDVWYGAGHGPDVDKFTVLKGLQVRWAGGEYSDAVGTCPPDEEERILHTSFDFERGGDDPLEWMDIYASTARVDSLRLVTQDERDHFEAGGTGGDKQVQPAHGRKLYGFYGRADADIDQLGAIFGD